MRTLTRRALVPVRPAPAALPSAATHSRACSNRALQRLLATSAVQAKLRASTPDDAPEREADRVADQVMRMPAEGMGALRFSDAQAVVQRKCPACEEDDRVLQRQTAEPGSPPRAQADPVPGAGSPLSASERAFFEPRFGRDLAHVRLHSGPLASQLAESIQARAFTYGRDIVLGSGELASGTESGKRLLAHELAHTIQQGARPNLIQRLVRPNLVSCRNPTAAQQATVGADPVGTLDAANTRAVELMDNAIATLEFNRNAILAGAEPTSPTVGDATAAALQSRMRINPSNRAVWTGTGIGSVQLLIRRLRMVRNLLGGGWLSYTCIAPAAINTATCAGPACGGATRAASCEGVSRLFLCTPFWADSADDQAGTLMHESFHIYFGFIDDVGHEGNAHCYEQLVFDLNGVAINPAFVGSCPA